MKKIRIAQIGTSANSHGNMIWESLIKQNDIFEVVGYALPENERVKYPTQAAAFKGYREMTVEEILSDPTIEAVTVETEEVYLTKYALMAAKAGKHIHMEKPGGHDLPEFEKMIAAVKAGKKVFHTGYMYRYNPAVAELVDQVKNGELGEIISVDAEMSCTHSKITRDWLNTTKGGMMFFLGCHLIDLVLSIQGKPLKITHLNRSSGLDENTFDDFGFAVLEYKNGVSTVKTTDVEMGGFERRHVCVVGTKKTVEIRPLEYFYGSLQFATKTDYCSQGWADKGLVRDTPAFDRYDGMMASFAAMVRGEKKNPYTLDYELELYKLVLECAGMKR